MLTFHRECKLHYVLNAVSVTQKSKPQENFNSAAWLTAMFAIELTGILAHQTNSIIHIRIHCTLTPNIFAMSYY